MSGAECVAWWYASGLACALVWPIWYRKGMKGNWGPFFKMLPVFGVFGPLALVASFPV